MADAGPIEHAHLPDGWLFAVETTDSEVRFLLDAVLQPGRPRSYSPPIEEYARHNGHADPRREAVDGTTDE